jgi:hypothetical protein
MIEASGVTVAFQFEDFDSRFEKARYAPKRRARRRMIALSISSPFE